MVPLRCYFPSPSAEVNILLYVVYRLRSTKLVIIILSISWRCRPNEEAPLAVQLRSTPGFLVKVCVLASFRASGLN